MASSSALLALAEASEQVTRRAYPWAPAAAFGGKAAALWSLSAEALEEMAGLLGGGAVGAAAEPRDEGREAAGEATVPSGRGLTCVACGLAFADRRAQASHFASPEHLAARRATPEDAAAAAEAATDDGEDDEEEEDDDEASEEDEASEGEEDGVAPGRPGGARVLRVDGRSSTVEAPLGAALVASLCAAAAGGVPFVGSRSARAATPARAAARLAALAAARRASSGAASSRGASRCVVVLRSGKFAGAVFDGLGRLVRHQVFSRYTTRRGQGGAQSAMDGSGKKVKSVGSTLRRHGERALAEDVVRLLRETWQGDVAACEGIYVACARAMRPLLFGGDEPVLDAREDRVQKVPFAVAKPTLAHVVSAYERLMTVFFHAPAPPQPAEKPARERAERAEADGGGAPKPPPPPPPDDEREGVPVEVEVSPEALAVLAAAEAGDEAALADALGDDAALARCRAADGSSPLHVAARRGAPDVVLFLLRRGADPAARDDHGRVPYVLAPDRKTREAFIKARSALGEAARDWRDAAVPEPLDDAAAKAKKAKEAEKKKRQRERQKAAKKEAALDQERTRRAADAAEAARLAKAAADDLANRCASCGGPVRGAPFTRLDFLYCSAACVQDHRRRLMADAAEARFRKK